MARPLQRRKNKSSIPKKRQKTKSKKQILSNPIIAANWYECAFLIYDAARMELTMFAQEL